MTDIAIQNIKNTPDDRGKATGIQGIQENSTPENLALIWRFTEKYFTDVKMLSRSIGNQSAVTKRDILRFATTSGTWSFAI